ncbi:MAG: DUF4355 domain-containing protein [Firmicutes bacterium]|jgi:flagellar biosynthesis GTPase FlhF|nr:DUF4355 domain-containing protein [Bacillota bacterium]
MDDDAKNTNPGNPADAGQGNQDQQADKKTFTQEELDRIIQERLAREREKYKDYADLKKAAEELKKLKESQMSEAEKLQAKIAEYERRLLEKEREAAEARVETLKMKVLDEMGLPKAWAGRIFGTTEDEIRKDADELKKLLGAAGKPLGAGTNPPAKSDVNPWKKETFNLTMQAKILRENPALAARLKAEAGAGG